MNLRQALREARDTLASAHIEDAALESEILLMHLLKIDRVKLYTDIGTELAPRKYEEFTELVHRRLDGEPSAYITNNREFYGLDFYVDSSVLIPRPETELLVETAIELAEEKNYRNIVDVGTGSGIIAVCLALNLPDVKIYATDISKKALDVAIRNCRTHGVQDRIKFLAGDMLEPLPEPVDMIVANLPYVEENEVQKVNTAGYEPAAALNGGEDGLQFVSELVRQSLSKLLPGGSILLEIGQGQGEATARQLKGTYPYGGVKILPDLSGIDRVVRLSLPQDTRPTS